LPERKEKKKDESAKTKVSDELILSKKRERRSLVQHNRLAFIVFHIQERRGKKKERERSRVRVLVLP